MKLILAASALLAGYLGWRSLDWPLIHDAPLMHYVAWLMTQGAVPYRDVFDMNFPGVYLLHLAVTAGLGPGDLAWRLFDLGWLGATAGLCFAFCRPLGGTVGAAGAALLVTLYHLAGGAWRVGQRDFLLGIFLVAGVWGVARSWEAGGALPPLAGAGLALGAAMMLKPQAAVFWLACMTVAAVGRRRAGRGPVPGAAAVLAAGLVVPAAILGWLAWRGGLGPFLVILVGYVLPRYSRVGRAPLLTALGWHRYGWALLAFLAALAGLGFASRPSSPVAIRAWLALAGVAYGIVHFVSQGKGWEYHLYPLALFLCLLVAPALTAEPARALRRAAVATALAGAVVVLGAKAVDALDAPWIAVKQRRVASLAEDLRGLVPPGDTVQVMDTTAGGIHALLRLRVRQPTRFIYDFQFFHDVGDPRIEALRGEFAAALAARPPAAIVVLEESWPETGYARLRRFPRVENLLERDYVLAVDGDGYRIYAKRSRP